MERLAAALDSAAARLARAGLGSPRFEAELLLARLMGVDRGGLLVRRDERLASGLDERFDAWITRRASREPLQHITGVAEFHGLEFRCDRRALIPRPETEGLVDVVLELLPEGCGDVADLGTGSGCIAVSLAVKRPALRLHALDRSPEALELAGENVRAHAVAERVALVVGEMGRPPADWSGRMDAVVSNPPYVTADDWSTLEPEVRDHDPREALVPGPTGLEAYDELVPAAAGLLRPGGALILEIGYGQSAEVCRIVEAQPFESVGVRPDLSRIPRVLVARRA